MILEALISFSPDSYERLLGDALRNVIAGTVEAFTVIDSFESSVHRLSGEARLRLWHILEEKEPNYVVQRVFAFLAGGDVDWISSVLANQTVSADFVMSAFNDADNALSIEDLSRLLVPLGVSPRKIAESAQWGFYTGQRSKHVQSTIDKMSALSRSNENVLQEVGQAGLAFYPPLLEKILKEERRKDILGEL